MARERVDPERRWDATDKTALNIISHLNILYFDGDAYIISNTNVICVTIGA